MNVKELNREQLTELKQHYYMFDKFEEEQDISYYELACINELVTDEEVFEYYANYDFTCDDFFCSCGQYDIYKE